MVQGTALNGIDTRLTRTYAGAPRGQRAPGRVPGGHWQRLTVLGALACDGLAAVMTIAAATSTAVFLAFVEGVLVPALRSRPDALVVMDNLAPHKAAAVRAALDRAGLTHRYLPAYSPDPAGQCPAADRALLVQAQGHPPRPRRAHRRGARGGAPRGHRRRHAPGRPGVVPPLRLSFTLNRKPL
jgi:DDE superfamily endonuclease